MRSNKPYLSPNLEKKDLRTFFFRVNARISKLSSISQVWEFLRVSLIKVMQRRMHPEECESVRGGRGFLSQVK